MVPDLSYEDLVISDGGLTMHAFLESQDEDDTDRVNAICSDPWKCCKLDTLAMVKILEKLESL